MLEAETDESMVLLTTREVDVILSMECRAAPRPDDPRYHREELLGDILDVVLTVDHALARRERIDLAELRVEPLTLGAGWRD